MNRVLITGASGFVGANLARRLLHDSYEVHLLLRNDRDNWRLRDINSECRITIGDVSDGDSVRSCVRKSKPQIVFHLAAYGAYSYQTGMEAMIATNLLGCVSLMDACVESNVECFVQTGSSSEYGYKDHAANEEEHLEPNSHYAITKAAATHYCSHAAKTSGIRAATARLYSVYGPFEEPTRLIPTLLVHCLKGKLPPLVSPTTARDFVFVDDAVAALVRIAQSSAMAPGAVYNVSSGTQVRLEQLVEQVRSILRVDEEPRWGAMPGRQWDTDVWVGNAAAIERDIGWKAETSLADGLRATAEWFRGNQELLRYYEARIWPSESRDVSSRES